MSVLAVINIGVALLYFSRLAFCRYEKFSLISLSHYQITVVSFLNTHSLLKTKKKKEIWFSLKQPALNTVPVRNTQNTILKKRGR